LEVLGVEAAEITFFEKHLMIMLLSLGKKLGMQFIGIFMSMIY
jgi:hypothetical protein